MKPMRKTKKSNYVKFEGTLKIVDIIKGFLRNKFGYNEDELKVLTEAEATNANFVNAINGIIASEAKLISYILSAMDIQSRIRMKATTIANQTTPA